MAKTIEQRIAEEEKKLAQLKARARKQRDGQLYVIGGAMMRAVEADDRFVEVLHEVLQTYVTRAEDQRRVNDLMGRLEAYLEQPDPFEPQPHPTEDDDL